MQLLIAFRDNQQISLADSTNASLIGYSDSDWGENKDDRHSTLGQVFTLANSAISWASQCQKTVALSVGESDVKSELRHPIIQVIRSQWESQDLPALGNQYHGTDDTASQEQGYNTCAPNQG